MTVNTNAQKIHFNTFEKALLSLKRGLEKIPMNELERDGIIQRFEYTFELSWKSIRKLLISLGRIGVRSSPKPILLDALEEDLIYDIEAWFGYLEARNKSSSICNEKQAESLYQAARIFVEDAELLLCELRSKVL